MGFTGQAGRNYSSAAPGRVVKGLSALDLVIEAGYLPIDAGPVEFAAWLRAPVDEIVGDLAILVNPIVDAAMVPYTAAMAAQVQAAEDFATEASESAFDAGVARDAAMDYRDQAQQIVDDFEATAPTPASRAEIMAATNNSKYIAPDQLGLTAEPVAVTFNANAVPDFATSQYWKVTMTGNITAVAAPTNCKIGRNYVFEFLSDGTARTLPSASGWDGGSGAYDWGSAGFPTMVSGANKRNLLTGLCYSTSPLKLAMTHWKNA